MAKILTIDGKNIRALDKTKFNLESDLQDYLEKYPSIIPIEEIYEDASDLICIGREVTVPSGAIDLIYIDKEGLITIVETKLVKNPEIRRTVIGQLIEYASFVSQWTADYVYEIATDYLKHNLVEVLANSDVSDFPEEEYKHSVEDNLKKGKIRLIIAVDELNEPLRATVTFLNSYSNFDFLLLQVSSFEESETKKVLIPSLFGYATKSVKTSSPRTKWDWERFLTDIQGRCESEIADLAVKLYEFTRSNSDSISWGTGTQDGSFTFRKLGFGGMNSIFSMYSYGWVCINFGSMKDKDVPDSIMESFRVNLNKIPNTNLPKEAVTKGRYPRINEKPLTNSENLKVFEDAVISLCQQLENRKE